MVLTHAIPPGATPRLLLVRLNGKPSALFPMLNDPSGGGFRALTTPYTCLYEPLIVADEADRAASFVAFARYCRSFPVVRLDALDPGSNRRSRAAAARPAWPSRGSSISATGMRMSPVSTGKPGWRGGQARCGKPFAGGVAARNGWTERPSRYSGQETIRRPALPRSRRFTRSVGRNRNPIHPPIPRRSGRRPPSGSRGSAFGGWAARRPPRSSGSWSAARRWC